eukprot:38702_1
MMTSFWINYIQHVLAILSLPDTSLLYDYSLQFHMLDILYPIKTYGGIGAIYNDTLYGLSRINCSDSLYPSCNLNAQYYTQHTLNLSSIQLDISTILKEIRFSQSPSWFATQIVSTPTQINAITSLATSTILDHYAWIIHPNIALQYNLKTYAFVNQTFIPRPSLIKSCTANDGTYILTIGGYEDTLSFVSNQVYRYHTINGRWDAVNDLHIARYSASCTFIDDALYVLGGHGSRDKLRTIEVYTHNTWTVHNQTLSTERDEHISITHPKKWIITIGGSNQLHKALNVELFDPSTGWIALADVMFARKEFMHTVYKYDMNTQIVFVSGGTFNGIVFDDIQYMVISTSDEIFPIVSTTAFIPNETDTTTHGNDTFPTEISTTVDKDNAMYFLWIRWSKQLLIVMICVASFVLILCVVLLVVCVQKKRKDGESESGMYSPKLQSPTDLSRAEGVRKSSEDLLMQQREECIESESEDEYEEDSDLEKMYVVPPVNTMQRKRIKKANKQMLIGPTTGADDGEDHNEYEDVKNYGWITKALQTCDSKDWKIYLTNFKRNKVTESRLYHLTDDAMWIELIPELGVRSQFLQLWEQRKIIKNWNDAIK